MCEVKTYGATRTSLTAEKLSQALEVMAYGLELKRHNLERDRPDATVTEIEQAFDAWVFERG